MYASRRDYPPVPEMNNPLLTLSGNQPWEDAWNLGSSPGCPALENIVTSAQADRIYLDWGFFLRDAIESTVSTKI